jgi:hypothetical protein
MSYYPQTKEWREPPGWWTLSEGTSRVFRSTLQGYESIDCEDHVWFEDRWMVASLCDEWLTTLCGLILGLTGVGAGEEQERKVVAGEASRCGEDK